MALAVAASDAMMPHKILLIHQGGGIGGAPVSMLQLAAGLDRGRFQPTVVFTDTGPILEFARQARVPVRVVRLRSAFFYSAHVPLRARMLAPLALHAWPTVREARALVRRERPALVHLNTSVLVPTAVGVKREGVPLVWHVREVPGSNALLRRWHTGVIERLADRIVVNSDFVRQAFPADVPVAVIHNAIDVDRFRIDEIRARARVRLELGIPPTAPVVGMIGSVQVVKGHSLLVRTAQRLVREIPDVHFLIVAGGVGRSYERSWKGRLKRVLRRPLDNLEAMQRQVARAGLAERFTFSGYRSDIPELLAAMDVLAFLPQAPEGFGRPLIEAMAIGRPVVATRIGPTEEILGTETGILVAPGDAEGIISAVRMLLGSAELRRRLGAVGRERAAARFGLTQMVSAMERVCAELLEEYEARRRTVHSAPCQRRSAIR